jgi:hypothetical protein
LNATRRIVSRILSHLPFKRQHGFHAEQEVRSAHTLWLSYLRLRGAE